MGSGGVIFNQSFLATKAKDIMPVMNKLTMPNELGNHRVKLSAIVEARIEREQYIAKIPVIKVAT